MRPPSVGQLPDRRHHNPPLRITIICETVHQAPPGLHGVTPYGDQFVCVAAARWAASSCRQLRAAIQNKPPKRVPTIASIKITLAEKPKLIPSTPPLPATLEGSLQPSQAMTAGAFAKTAPIREARKSRIASNCANSNGRAIDKPKIRLWSFVVESCRAEYWSVGLCGNCTPGPRVGRC